MQNTTLMSALIFINELKRFTFIDSDDCEISKNAIEYLKITDITYIVNQWRHFFEHMEYYVTHNTNEYDALKPFVIDTIEMVIRDKHEKEIEKRKYFSDTQKCDY